MRRVGLVLGMFMVFAMLPLTSLAEEGSVSYDLAFVDPGRWDSSYYIFDTDADKVIYFDIADDLVMEAGNLVNVDKDLQELYVDRWDCCGCTVYYTICSSQAITMRSDGRGINVSIS